MEQKHALSFFLMAMNHIKLTKETDREEKWLYNLR